MNTPHQGAGLQGAYSAADACGRRVLIALFDGTASDGHQTNFEARDVSWCVWMSEGRVVACRRYSGRNRPRAKRDFDSIPAMLPTVTEVPEYSGLTWKQWAPLAQQDTQESPPPRPSATSRAVPTRR